MFKVKIGEDEYEVEFDHRIPGEHDRRYMDAKAFRKMFGTVCMITRNSILYTTGSADLSPKDNFSREVGRKVSLTHALGKGFPGQPKKRKLFWDAYYKARGGKW